MSAPGTPTIDQLRILIAIADSGSFSEAGRRLNRAQSVISYTLANLEQQLGLPLFTRGQRRPTLTDAGIALLGEARRVIDAVDLLRARAAGLLRGLEAEVTVVVDVMYPTAQLVIALEAFAATYPTVTLRLRVEALGAAVQLVLDGTCTLGVASWLATRHADLDIRAIGSAAMIAVAAPHHRLAQLSGPIALTDLRDDIQLVLTDRSPLSEGEDFGVRARRTWRLGDMAAKHALLRAGLGWGNMPANMITEDLAQNRLVHLNVADSTEEPYKLLLIRRQATPLGPAAQWLADRLAAAMAGTG
jgi:DNA-binding transcriptional LysR family regulator